MGKFSIPSPIPRIEVESLARHSILDFRFEILDVGGDPTDKFGGLRILDFRIAN